jgi:hypothetical protein
MATDFHRRLIIVGVIAIFIVVGLGWCIYVGNNPGDQVTLRFYHLPDDVDSLVIVHESGGRADAMKWYYHDELGFPFTSKSGRPVRVYLSSNGPPGVYYGPPVQWQAGERFGVVMLIKDGTWRIAWFNAEAVPIQGRNLLGRNGQVTFDRSNSEIVSLKDEDAAAFGLDSSLRPR